MSLGPCVDKPNFGSKAHTGRQQGFYRDNGKDNRKKLLLYNRVYIGVLVGNKGLGL